VLLPVAIPPVRAILPGLIGELYPAIAAKWRCPFIAIPLAQLAAEKCIGRVFL
jgi:hypothetical protein